MIPAQGQARGGDLRLSLAAAIVAFGSLYAPQAVFAGGTDGASQRFDKSIDRLSRAHGVPERLIRRIIMRESRYAPHLTNRGHYGLMQIKLETAKGMGYRGSSSGLLDGETNLTYAVPYLANAYIAADQNEDRAVQLYAGGYYYVAKHKGLLAKLRTANSRPVEDTTLVAYADEQPPPQQVSGNPFAALFGQAPAAAPAPAEQQQAEADGPPQDWATEGEDLVIFESAPLPPKRPARI